MDKHKTEPLKPCPFCGNKDIECVETYVYSGLHEGGWCWQTRCNFLKGGCGCTVGRITEEESRKLWNTRISEN